METDDREITVARVIPWSGDVHGVALSFDRGRRSAVVVGSKADAEELARAAVGQGDAFLVALKEQALTLERSRFRIVDT